MGLWNVQNKEIMRNLRSIVYDERVLDKWELYLPMVERIVNSSYNSAIGTAPISLVLGDAVTVNRGIFNVWDPPLQSIHEETSKYMKELNLHVPLRHYEISE